MIIRYVLNKTRSVYLKAKLLPTQYEFLALNNYFIIALELKTHVNKTMGLDIQRKGKTQLPFLFFRNSLQSLIDEFKILPSDLFKITVEPKVCTNHFMAETSYGCSMSNILIIEQTLAILVIKSCCSRE